MRTSPDRSSHEKLGAALRSFSLLDELAQQDSPLHRIHPAIHLACTIIYILLVASFGRYEAGRLVPYILYPAALFSLSQLPAVPILKRAAVALPFILGVGLANLLTDRTPVLLAGLAIRGGWISLASLVLKTILSVLAALLLTALTGMTKLSYALRLFGVPKFLVLQLSMTVRYSQVLAEEAMLTTMAYKLRAPAQRGIRPAHWGPVGGGLLLRTYDRARFIGHAMKLLRFSGEFHPGGITRLVLRDWIYLAAWIVYFAAARLFNFPGLLGSVWGSLG